MWFIIIKYFHWVFQPNAEPNYSCVPILTFASASTGTAGRVLKHCIRPKPHWGSEICWLPVPFTEQGHLMPTMKPVPHYPSACQDEAPAEWCTTNMPFILFNQIYRSGRHMPVRECQHRHTNRLVESSGVGWAAADVFWYCLLGTCSPPIKNAESTKIHSPQNNITKTGDKPVDGSGYQKLWGICCFSFDRLVVQHMGWVMRRGRMRMLCTADSCQHNSCGFLTICLESQSLTDPLQHDDINNLDMIFFPPP